MSRKTGKHPAKGEYGYFAWEKIKRTLIVAFMLGICLLIYFTGLYRTHTRRNFFTLIAILGVLPTAKWIVNMIMAYLQKPASKEAFEITEKYAGRRDVHDADGGDGGSSAEADRRGGLSHGYELCVTAEQGRLALDAVVVVGNYVVAYTSAEKGLFEFMQKHIAKMLSGNGLYGANVKIFLDLSKYEERIKALSHDPDAYRVNLKNAADAVHDGETRDEAVMRVIRNISI